MTVVRMLTRVAAATLTAALVWSGTPARAGADAAVPPPEAGVQRGPAELSDDARALSPDTAAALDAYWTRDRMAAALPADLLTGSDAPPAGPVTKGPDGPETRIEPVRAPGGPDRPADAVTGGGTAMFWPYRGDMPATAVGRVFFQDQSDHKNYSCSAAVTDSVGKDLVWTAGHCVHHGKYGTWHKNWVFYPHYYYGADPHYGAWHSIGLGTSGKWLNDSDFSYDYGASWVAPNAAGQNLVSVTGALGLAWNSTHSGYATTFGYPAKSPFTGMTLQYCSGNFWSHYDDVGMYCTMTNGSSGGPWIGWFNGWTGYINGNVSYSVAGKTDRFYSPYYGSSVGNLYHSMNY